MDAAAIDVMLVCWARSETSPHHGAGARAATHLYDELSRKCDTALAEKGRKRADLPRAAYDALTRDL